MTQFRSLGVLGDWVEVASRARPLYPIAPPGPATQRQVRAVLNFSLGEETPAEVRVEGHWERDGLAGDQVSWSVGYGPRTQAWVLKPAGVHGPLPGVLALHDHGGFKLCGKEKIADGPVDPAAGARQFREECYGGRAFANELAKEGFVVLVHDTFLWGSRRFPLQCMPETVRRLGEIYRSWYWQTGYPEEVALYNAAASIHEHLVEQYCAYLGTTLAGVVSYEDGVAANYLASRSDVIPERIGCLGLSGGGARSGLLQATCERVSAAAVVAMMTTYRETCDEIIAALHACVDPGTGLHPFNLVLRKADMRYVGLYGDPTAKKIGDVLFTLREPFGGTHGEQLSTAQWGLGSVTSLLLMWGAGIRHGVRLERTAWLTDIVATICRLIDVQVPRDTEGAILYQALEDPS